MKKIRNKYKFSNEENRKEKLADENKNNSYTYDYEMGGACSTNGGEEECI
jgi:hypothetical protein